MSMTRQPWPAAVIEAVVELLERARNEAPADVATVVLAVDGPSGAGKTTLATGLANVLKEKCALVRMEDLYPGWDGLEAATGRLATEVLPALLRGEPARYRRWDWSADRYGTVQDVVPAKEMTIVEGVGSGAPAAAPMVSALVFVDAPEQVRHARAMARDGEGYRSHWQRWADQERRYFSAGRTADRADLLLLPGSVQARALP